LSSYKAHEAYEKDLNTAAVKIKELQDENECVITQEPSFIILTLVPQAFY
jgi:hypothetical protein